MNDFIYDPVQSQIREIRLVTLLPGRTDKTLVCELSTTSLASKSLYNALSYVWGPAPGSSSSVHPANIILGGHIFQVEANLNSALQRLRPGVNEKPIILWIDAICIDQSNVHERTEQVALMRDIYESATKVVIWLGEEQDDEDLVFHALPSVARREHDDCAYDIKCQVGTFFSRLATQRPWFSRVWILQELAMAQNDPLVALGCRLVYWSVFVGAWRVIAEDVLAPLGSREQGQQSSFSASDTRQEEIRHIEIFSKMKLDLLRDLREKVQSYKGPSLPELLSIPRTSAATDPRDRIYGLLGLLKANAYDAHANIPIPIDYRKSTAEVYTDAMTHIFSRGEGPFFLAGQFLAGKAVVAPKLPGPFNDSKNNVLQSWVPDFSRQSAGRTSQPCGTNFHPASPLSASGAGNGADNGRVLDDVQTLKIAGLFVDTIDQVIPLGVNLESVIGNLEDLQRMADEASKRPGRFDNGIAPLMDQFKKSEALWRVLISNKKYASGYDIAPPEYEDMFMNLLNGQDHSSNDAPLPAKQDDIDENEYKLCLQSKIGKQSFFTTTSGFIGICIPDSRSGDIVTICFGSPCPFVLRPQPNNMPSLSNVPQTHSLIGCAYVGGIMAGEMVNELYCEDLMDATMFFIQ